MIWELYSSSTLLSILCQVTSLFEPYFSHLQTRKSVGVSPQKTTQEGKKVSMALVVESQEGP